MIKRHWIILYDISNLKTLKKIAKIMESKGNRVQKSVFEVYCDDNELQRIKRRLSFLINKETDSLAFLPLCQLDYEKTVRLGVALPVKQAMDKEDKSSLFL